MNIFQWCNHPRKVSIGGPGVIPSLPVPQPGLQAGLTRRSWREEEEGEGVWGNSIAGESAMVYVKSSETERTIFCSSIALIYTTNNTVNYSATTHTTLRFTPLPSGLRGFIGTLLYVDLKH